MFCTAITLFNFKKIIKLIILELLNLIPTKQANGHLGYSMECGYGFFRIQYGLRIAWSAECGVWSADFIGCRVE